MLFGMSRVNIEVCSEVLNSVKVNIFHLQPVVRIGLASWLKQAGVGHFSVKSNVTELLGSHVDEILLLDIESIQGIDNDSFQRLERSSAPKTVVITTCEQLDRFGGRLPGTIGSLISPRDALGDLVHAILAITNQRSYVSPRLTATWDRVLADPGFELTSRQHEVLQLVARGNTSVQIATLLGLRPKTVENHRAAIKARMGVVSAAEMVNKAHRRGIC